MAKAGKQGLQGEGTAAFRFEEWSRVWWLEMSGKGHDKAHSVPALRRGIEIPKRQDLVARTYIT